MAKSETVPKAMQEKFDRITAITDEFAKQHLNEEYAQIIRRATAALCRKRPSPLASGKEKTWACGITHAIGMVNFLFDSSQTPHITAKELYDWFGVGASTGQAKSKQVRDMLGTHQMDPKWTLESLVAQNPLNWLISIDGFLLDARTAPPEVQQALAARGLIPRIAAVADDEPDDPSDDTAGEPVQNPGKGMAANQTAAAAGIERQPQTPGVPLVPDNLYILQVHLTDGPMADEFVEANPVVSRTIAIKGGQTLADLHRAIFQAFDREEEHMYEFQVGGSGPNDPDAKRYGLKQAFSASLSGDTPDGDVAKTQINDLGLTVGQVFGYWFDFGDDWWHFIEVEAIQAKSGKGKYPKVTHRVGASPPQYADFD